MTSGLSAKILGLPSVAPTVSEARRAKPSTFERSKGGASTAAMTSLASTRVRDSASATVSAGRGPRSRCCSKRTRASSADTTSRNCSCRAAARTRFIRSLSSTIRGFLDSFIVQHPRPSSWPRPYLNGCSGGISFAVCGDQNPSVRAGKRRQGKISDRHRLDLTVAAPDRNNFRQSHSRADFARKGKSFRRFVFAALCRSEPIEKPPPEEEPDAERGIEPSGQEQHRPRADKPECGGLSGCQRQPVHPQLSFAGEDLYAVVVPPAARSADRNDCVSAVGRQRNIETPAAFVQSGRTATSIDVGRNRTCGGADDAAAAHRQNANAGLAHQDAGNSRR